MSPRRKPTAEEEAQLLLDLTSDTLSIPNELGGAQVIAQSRLTHDLRTAATTMSSAGARFIVDMFYKMQYMRISSGAQVRAMSVDGEPNSLIQSIYHLFAQLETDMKQALRENALSHPASRWAMNRMGIGPVIAAGLRAHIGEGHDYNAGQLARFAGLDPTDEWLGAKEATEVVQRVTGYQKVSDPIREEDIDNVALATNAKILEFRQGFARILQKKEKEGEPVVEVVGTYQDLITFAGRWISFEDLETMVQEVTEYTLSSDPVTPNDVLAVALEMQVADTQDFRQRFEQIFASKEEPTYRDLINFASGELRTMQAEDLVARVTRYQQLTDPVDEEALSVVAMELRVDLETFQENFQLHIGGKTPTYKDLINFAARRPWNADLKRLCYLLGESFIRTSNRPGTEYGPLWRERKAREQFKNERKDYADQAQLALATKSFRDDTEAIKWYSKDMLPPGHIHARARRWVVKLFLSHFATVLYETAHPGQQAPMPYPIKVLKHVDYIPPFGWPFSAEEEEAWAKSKQKAASNGNLPITKSSIGTPELGGAGLIAQTRLKRDIRKAAVELDQAGARYLVDTYYEIQKLRIMAAAQIRAMEKAGEPNDFVIWIFQLFDKLEDDIKKALEENAPSHPASLWAMNQMGVGPVIAACLRAYINITRTKGVLSLWRFAGLDPTDEWLGKEEAEKLVREITQFERPSHKVTEEHIRAVAEATLANPFEFREGFEKIAGEEPTYQDLISFTARRPWNADLKKLCYLLGESFIKTSNRPGAVYGPLYRRRKDYETRLNNEGHYKEQAAQALLEKNYNPATEAYKQYSAGKLPLAQIHARARRFAVKAFLANFYRVLYMSNQELYESTYPDREPPIAHALIHFGKQVEYLLPPGWPLPPTPEKVTRKHKVAEVVE